MGCPEFFHFIRPSLEAVIGNPNAHWREIGEAASVALNLSAEDREEVVASGNKSKFEDRVQWALTYLRQAKLVESSGRGRNRPTSRGLEFVRSAPRIIKPIDLEAFPEFQAFHKRESNPANIERGDHEQVLPILDVTPLDAMTSANSSIRAELANTLLERLKGVEPSRFERIIVELMLRLGYGGPREDAGQTLGRSGDGGVDGIIRQDRLGLDNIYLQAKRWSGNTVGTAEVNGFIGALTTRGASKGVLITTSKFSDSARKVATSAPHLKLSLIDGDELARLMIDHDLGVALEARFDVKRIDSDYFAEE